MTTEDQRKKKRAEYKKHWNATHPENVKAWNRRYNAKRAAIKAAKKGEKKK